MVFGGLDISPLCWTPWDPGGVNGYCSGNCSSRCLSHHTSAPAASSCSEGANQSLRDVLGLKIKTDHPRLRRQRRAVAATLQLGGEGQGCALV